MLGQIEEKRENWQQAQADYRKVLDLAPGNVVAKNNLAWVYSEHGGDIDVALRMAQEAVESNPDDPAICDTLGWIYVKKQILGNAIQLLQQSVDRKPDDAEYNYHLGVAYWRAGRAADAKKYLQASLRLQPDFPDAGEAKKMLQSPAD